MISIYALSKRIWKDFVIQIKAGILPSEAIIVEDGKLNYQLRTFLLISLLLVMGVGSRRPGQ